MSNDSICAEHMRKHAIHAILCAMAVMFFSGCSTVKYKDHGVLATNPTIFRCIKKSKSHGTSLYFDNQLERITPEQMLRTKNSEHPEYKIRNWIAEKLKLSNIYRSEKFVFYRRGYHIVLCNNLEDYDKTIWVPATTMEEREVAIDDITFCDTRLGCPLVNRVRPEYDCCINLDTREGKVTEDYHNTGKVIQYDADDYCLDPPSIKTYDPIKEFCFPCRFDPWDNVKSLQYADNEEFCEVLELLIAEYRFLLEEFHNRPNDEIFLPEQLLPYTIEDFNKNKVCDEKNKYLIEGYMPEEAWHELKLPPAERREHIFRRVQDKIAFLQNLIDEIDESEEKSFSLGW